MFGNGSAAPSTTSAPWEAFAPRGWPTTTPWEAFSRLGTGGVPGARPARIQAALDVSQPGDPLEQEADRLATRVVDSGATAGAVASPGRAMVSPARESASAGGGGTATAPAEAALESARAQGGRPLPATLRQSMEAGFGAEFGAVRVHEHPQAHALAARLGARAFTAGEDLFFRRGELDASTARGRHLVAHELTHVLQQRQGEPGTQTKKVQRQAAPEAKTPPNPKTPPDPKAPPQSNSGGDLPQTHLTLQFPFQAAFQVPITGSKGVSSILHQPSATNTPYDTAFQPSGAIQLDWSFHPDPTGWELTFGAQGAGLLGTAGAGTQVQFFLQPAYVVFSSGPHQVQFFGQPSGSVATGGTSTAGKAVSLAGGVQYAYTLKETRTQQWQLFAQATAGGQLSELSNPPPGTPGTQLGAFAGIAIGFQFNRVLSRYPPGQSRGTSPSGDTGPEKHPPEEQPKPEGQQSQPHKQDQKKQDDNKQPQPQPQAPQDDVLPAMDLFFQFDRPSPGPTGASPLTSEGGGGLANLLAVLQAHPKARVQLIGLASIEGSADYNFRLGARRATWVAAHIPADRLYDPPENDLRSECTRVERGIYSCGKAGAHEKDRVHDRKVLVRFFTP